MDTLGMVSVMLRGIDAQVAVVSAALVEGKAPSFDGYRSLVGRRAGLLAARRCVVECLSAEQRQFIGLTAK